MSLVRLECPVDAATAGRIDRVVQQLTARSRADVRGLFDHQCVTLNGQPCAESGALTVPGDVVGVRHDPQQRYREKPKAFRDKSFQLIYEDDSLLVVEKAAAVLTVPTDRGETDTLVDVLTRYLSRTRQGAKAWVVHRLDRGTSGLLLFGKTAAIAKQLQSQFRDHKPEREYAALVAGQVEPREGTFDSRLATSKSLQRFTTRRTDVGEDAVTHYAVESLARGCSFVRVWLETGRRNQIRVHFAEAGHPVLGDDRYQPERARHPAWTASRLALHARRLQFTHPVTETVQTFETPLPPEFLRFLGPRM